MAPLQKSKAAIETDELQIQHFIHQHLLQKIFMTYEFNCDGCNTGGHGVRYRCSACDFDMHEQCATSPYHISSHHLHPHHNLILVNRPGDSHVCHVCKGVTNGLSYTCEMSHACEFNIHPLCIQIPLALSGNNQPVLGGYNDQPVMVNNQKQGMHTMQLGGYDGLHTSQPHMVNHQQKQVIPTTALDGYHGINNNQGHMINQQQGIPMTAFDANHGVNNSQPMMVNHHHQQQQMMNQQQGAGFGGYDGGMNSQPVMVNHHQHQQLVHTTSFNNNQQLMANHHQQQLQQHQVIGIPPTLFGGYNMVNYNQNVMFNHGPPPPPPQQTKTSNGLKMAGKVGKLAGNIVSVSLIGVPLFNVMDVKKQVKNDIKGLKV